MPVDESAGGATPPEMSAKDAADLVRLFTSNDIEVWVDGGWGVDALLGEQTRKHDDLDIALRHRDVAALRKLLENDGYVDVPRDDTRECNFVLGDESGRLVDIHTFTFDSEGNCIFGLPYPVDSLTGTGTIDGYRVNCICAEWLVKFHTGYPLKPSDYHDVYALCNRFGIDPPPEYKSHRR